MMNMLDRKFPNVVVTGIAMTTALGTDAETTWQALLDGRSGIRRLKDSFIDEFDLPVRIGGHLLETFDHHLTSEENVNNSYVQRMALVLGRRVWENAGAPEVDPCRLAVSIGTGMGGIEELLFAYEHLRADRLDEVCPTAVQQYAPSGPSAAVALERRARAGVLAPVSACASGAEGLAQAWRHIVLGDADIAICGGVEARIEAVPIAGFAQMRIVMSTNNDDPAGACRPFDRDRDGFVFGEGGALLVIETEEHATARGARILGRLMGASDDLRRIPHGRPRPRREARRLRDDPRDRTGGAVSRRYRPRQRARDRHHRRRRRRVGGHQQCARRAHTRGVCPEGCARALCRCGGRSGIDPDAACTA